MLAATLRVVILVLTCWAALAKDYDAAAESWGFDDQWPLMPRLRGNVGAVFAEPGAPTRRLSRKGDDPYMWLQISEEAGFGPRYAHAALMTVQQHIYVLGGAAGDHDSESEGSGYLDDVWLSTDLGTTWEEVTPRSPKFSPRRGHAVTTDSRGVVMFVMGGFCGKACLEHDLWSSERGEIWTFIGTAPWSARHGHAAVTTSRDSIILLGGHDGSHYLSDVWSIWDPAQAEKSSKWSLVTAKAPWQARYGHAVVVDGSDRLFLLGGLFAEKTSGRIKLFNDVWRSDDEGATWHRVLKHAPWSGRYQHAAVLTKGSNLFVLGGLDSELQRCNDVWRSKNGGRHWTKVTPAAPWAPRYEHAAIHDQNGTIYILGGMSTGDSLFGDIWRSERTCADNVHCPGAERVCRDGTDENFAGLPDPICVGICDRRVFDNCTERQACLVNKSEAVCVDPCDHQKCGEGEVCEVAPRDEMWRGQMLTVATSYCLACGDARTSAACDKLAQCEWSSGDETCQTKCDVLPDEATCTGDERCQWADKACAAKPAEEEG